MPFANRNLELQGESTPPVFTPPLNPLARGHEHLNSESLPIAES